MTLLGSKFIKPLHRAETPFLQVLLDRFTLTRRGNGSELRVYFKDNTEAIWDVHGKDHLWRHIHPDDRAFWQGALDAHLLRREGGELTFPDAQEHPCAPFVFRYASGGTLPIIHFRGQEYFSFFYRDIAPIGWNIANGSCDNREELLNPFLAVERELREELLMLDFDQSVRYVFKPDQGKLVDRPEFAVARDFWSQRPKAKDLSALRESVIGIDWIDGPDSLVVQIGNRRPTDPRPCFLNINGDDFGIEIDRVARIHVSDATVFCDGEIEGPQLLNSPVGFFEVNRFREQFHGGGRSFMPDFFFFDTWKFDGSKLESTVNGAFIADLQTVRSQEELEAFEACENKFGLCPVTRAIVDRFFQLDPSFTAAAVPEPPEVFISYSHKDEKWKEDLKTNLKPYERSGRFTWWSDEKLDPGSNFEEEIAKVLARARAAILLVTPNFLASDFIVEKELAPILKANEERGLAVFWIPVEASAVTQTKLKPIHALHPVDKPLAEMQEKLSRAWTEICEKIAKALAPGNA